LINKPNSISIFSKEVWSKLGPINLQEIDDISPIDQELLKGGKLG
jgi:hypothetical protein